MNEEIEETRNALKKLQKALLTDNQEEWDKAINDALNSDLINENIGESFYIGVCCEIIITRKSSQHELIKYLVATYDNNNIRITIDASGNHIRAHIHIGIKKDKYHSASIAIDDGTILNNTGNIANWKIKKIVEWIEINKPILEKMFRCINPWGDTISADKRKDKLSGI